MKFQVQILDHKSKRAPWSVKTKTRSGVLVENPFERINAYTKTEGGGLSVDTEAMVADLVTVFKMGDFSLENLHKAVEEMWPQVHVKRTQR